MINSSISEKLSKGIVSVTFLGISIAVQMVGAVKFLMSTWLILLTFPLSLSYALNLPLPGWLLISLYALPLAWVMGLWTTGIRAWDRSNLKAALLFFSLAALGVAPGFWLVAHASNGRFYH